MAPEKPPYRFALIGPQIVEEKSFFFFWSKALTFFQTVYCLTTCHGPHLPLNLRHLPQENRFYFSKVITPSELGADGVGDMPCPFQLDRHVIPKVHGQVSKSRCPSDIQQRHSDFSRDDLRRHSCKILFDLSRSPEVFESSCDHHCPIFPWDGWKEKKRLREFFFFSHSANIYWVPAMCVIVLNAGHFF